MKTAFAVISMIVALVAPVFFFATTLLNEKYPALPYLVCIPLLAMAGFISGKANGKGGVGQWVIWCSLVGLVEAILFTVAG